MPDVRFQRDKFIELMLYVAQRSETDPKFGETKLNKLLYYIDFGAYRELGQPVTGARYHALPFGPAPVAYVPVRDELIEARDLHLRTGLVGQYEQNKPIALREPDLSQFSGAEIAYADAVIQALWDLDASQVSHMSHGEIGWQLARPKQLDIPYESAFIESIEVVPA